MLSNGLSTIAGPLFFGAHMAVFWLWLLLRVSEAIDSHSGYRIPFSPWQMFPIVQGKSNTRKNFDSEQEERIDMIFITVTM